MAEVDAKFQFETCMGTLVYHEGSNYLYNIGGMGSQGKDYRKKLTAG